MKILIIGGLGDFGIFYAKLFKKNGFDVYINDINKDIELVEELGFTFIEEDDFKEMDAVVVSVPNKIAPKVIKKIIPKLNQTVLLMDICSVKSFVFEELKKAKEKRKFEIVSLHPMHGPRVSSISAYPVIYIPIKEGEKFKQIKKFFKHEKAELIKSTAKEHDQVLAFVQGLSHYSQIVAAKTTKKMDVNLKKAEKFSSSNCELFMSLMSRVILQNPELYSQIQTENPYNKKMRKLFSKTSKELEKISNNENELKKEIIDSAKIFNGLDTILLKSDRALSGKQFIQNVLRENYGHKFLVENLENNTYHYGIIKKVDAHKLKLKNHKSNIILRLSKIRLTTKQEYKEWRRNHILERYIDHSFLVPKKAKPGLIVKAFSRIHHSRMEIIDEFQSNKFPRGKKSVTLRVYFFEDEDKQSINKQIHDLMETLGLIRR